MLDLTVNIHTQYVVCIILDPKSNLLAPMLPLSARHDVIITNQFTRSNVEIHKPNRFTLHDVIIGFVIRAEPNF